MVTTDSISALTERLLELAVRIQQVPAPTFHEEKRSEFIRQLLAAERLQDISVDDLHNVYARLPGRSRTRPLVVTAHLDTVFPGDSNPVRHDSGRIYGAGIGDNSLGVAALIGTAWMFRERGTEFESDLWLVANSCEEGLGDLRGMKAVVDRFDKDVRAYLVLEGTALGQVYHRAVGVQRYRVEVNTTGGHSWSDYGQPSAVHEVASIITQLTSFPLPSSPRTTMNVGTISGGSGVNILAAHARFDLDIRSESVDTLATLTEKVQRVIRSAARDGVAVDMQVIGQRPAGEISPSHPVVQLALRCLRDEGLTPSLTSGSTDANIPLSRGIPSIVLGLTSGAGAHTPDEYIDTDPVGDGFRVLHRFVMQTLKAP